MANFPALLTRITLGSALAALSHAQVSPNWIPTFGEHPGASSPVRGLAAVRRPGPQSQPLLGQQGQQHRHVAGARVDQQGLAALTIPQQVFAEDLKPEFKALFAGAAPKAPNPT